MGRPRKPVSHQKRKLSRSTKGYYRRMIGWDKRLDGTLARRSFYFGKDYEQAQIKSLEVETAWKKLLAEGTTYWTHQAIYDLEQRKVIHERKTGAPPKKMAGQESLLDIQHIRNRPEVQQYFDDAGDIKPALVIAWHRYLMTEFISKDKPTDQLRKQIAHLWENDPLGTLERIQKIGIAPSNLSLTIDGNTKIDFGDFLKVDASEDHTPAKMIDAEVIPAPSSEEAPKDKE